MSWAERLTGISPTITQFLFAPMLGRIASIGADITRHRRADRYRPREFGLHESDGTPDEKEGRPKQQPPGYQACMMAR